MMPFPTARGRRPLETEEVSWLRKIGNRVPWKCPSLWAHKWGSHRIIPRPMNWREEAETTQQHTCEQRLQAKRRSASPEEDCLLRAPHFSNPSPAFHLSEPKTHLKKGVNWEFYLILNVSILLNHQAWSGLSLHLLLNPRALAHHHYHPTQATVISLSD